MTDIFLSYNREDQARAKVFADAFAREGFKVWWDVGLHTGEAYDEVTETALRTAKAVVVLWSRKSVQSRWVRAEATLADRNRTLAPAMIEPCERPIMFELTQTAELGHWTGDTEDQAWAAFLADVRRFVGRERAVAPAPAPSAPASVQETSRPDQRGEAPSLAVLPFKNRSGLAEDEVFAEGMVEDVISALSQGVNVRVLGSTATASLRHGAITDLAAIGRQLGVRYLLEGNVRRAGANLRVTTQLLEAATGAVLWTAKFDRPLTELADLQEELVTEVAANLDVKVYSLEMERALRKPRDITAWEAVTRSVSAYREMNLASMLRAVDEAVRAVAVAPEYGSGHAALATARAIIYFVSGSEDEAEAREIREIAERALTLAPEDPHVLFSSGSALCFAGQFEEGIRHTARAVAKTPGSGLAQHLHAIACSLVGRHAEAEAHFATAARLMPGSHLLWAVQGWRQNPLMAMGRWEEALHFTEISMTLNPDFPASYIAKAVCCRRLGREAEAVAAIRHGRRIGEVLDHALMFHARTSRTNPHLADDLAIIRELWAAAD